MHTIAYITDIHLNEDYPTSLGADARKNWERILLDVAARKINHVIFGGDIGTPGSNQWFFESLNNMGVPFHVVLGNHDTYTEAIKHYTPPVVQPVNELFYSYEDENYQFIFLDSSADTVSDAQISWLQQQALPGNKNSILFIHHPVLPVISPIDKLYPLKNRDRLQQILLSKEHQITIFCGHYHMEDEQAHKNIIQYITPAASYRIIKEAAQFEGVADTFGYRLIHLAGDGIKTETILFNNDGGES